MIDPHVIAVCVFVAGFVVASFVLDRVLDAWRRASKRRRELDAVLRDYGGAALRIEGTEARIDFEAAPDLGRPQTRLHVNWSPPGVLRVVPAGFHTLMWKRIFGAPDIKLGIPAFDKAHMVQGHPAWWVRQMLDAELRGRIEALERMGDARVEAGPTGLVVRLDRDLSCEPPLLRDFIEHTAAVLKILRDASSGAGVELVAAGEAASQGRCPVCATDLEGEARLCDRCRTPHHPECWSYFGGCAVFACGRR